MATNTVGDGAKHVVGGFMDAGRSATQLLGHGAKLISKQVDRASQFMGNVGDQVKTIVEDDNPMNIPGKAVNVALNVAGNGAKHVAGGLGDVINTGVDVINTKIQFGTNVTNRFTNFTSNTLDRVNALMNDQQVKQEIEDIKNALNPEHIFQMGDKLQEIINDIPSIPDRIKASLKNFDFSNFEKLLNTVPAEIQKKLVNEMKKFVESLPKNEQELLAQLKDLSFDSLRSKLDKEHQEQALLTLKQFVIDSPYVSDEIKAKVADMDFNQLLQQLNEADAQAVADGLKQYVIDTYNQNRDYLISVLQKYNYPEDRNAGSDWSVNLQASMQLPRFL